MLPFIHKILSVGHLISVSDQGLFTLPIHWYRKWFEFKFPVITMTLLFKYSNEESVKQQTLGLVKHRETQIAQHQFNSQTLYVNTQRTTPIQFRNNTRKQRTSSHITETSQLLDLSLFVSVFMPFLCASSWAPGTVKILSPKSTCFCLCQSRNFVMLFVHDDYPLLRHTIFLQQY